MPRGLVVHGGLVWVAAARTAEVVAIDPARDAVVARVPVGRLPITMIGNGPDLWVSVLNGDASGASTDLVRIDTAARSAAERVAVPAFHAIPVGGGAAWAMGPDGVLRRFDTSVGEVTDEIDVGGSTLWIGADDTSVWGARRDGSAWRLDPATVKLTHEIDLGFKVPGRSRVAVGEGRFWVSVAGRTVAVDAATGELVHDLERPDDDLIDDLDVVGEHVWLSVVTVDGRGLLVHIDGATGEVVDELVLGPVPSELDVDGDTLWIGDQQDELVLRVNLS